MRRGGLPSGGATASIQAERAARRGAVDVGAGEPNETSRPELQAVDWSRIRLIYVEDYDPIYGDAVVAIYTDFPLALGTRGVVMGVVARLDAPRGKRKFLAGLIETHLLEHGRPGDRDEALLLLPSFEQILARKRAAMAWREYRPRQMGLLA